MLDHIPRYLLFKLLYKQRTLRSRSHQAHITHQNVEKLRHLVNTCLPDKPSDRCHTRIVGRRPSALLLRRRLDHHGPELVHLKRPVMKSHPFLAVDQRPRRRQLNERSGHQHNRRKQHNCSNGSEDINNPLHNRIDRIGQRYVSDIDNRQPL